MKNKGKALRYAAIIAIPVILSAILLISVCVKSNQATMSIPIKIEFQGEYSQNGGDLKPLDGASVSALDGDLYLRGNFNFEIPESAPVNLYLDHIAYCVSVNGEIIASSAMYAAEMSPFLSAKEWNGFKSPEITPDDTVEIMLKNPHKLGNINAYSDFLDSVYIGNKEVLTNMLEKETIGFRVIRLIMLILSVGIIGIAVAFSVMRLKVGKTLWSAGLLSLFASGYMIFDVTDVSLWSSALAYNTYAQQLCLMLAFLCLTVLCADNLKTGARKAGYILSAITGGIISVLVILCLANVMMIYDTLPVWVPVMLLVSSAFIAICLYDLIKTKERYNPIFYPCVILMLTLLADFANVYLNIWQEGILTKTAFTVLFFIYAVFEVAKLPKNYQEAIRAKKLQGDLKDTRITMALSQIRTHFVFNTLNAISGMCKYDPEKADRTVVRFARYLRSNIDIMEDDEPVSFLFALQHLEDYIFLEQIRFEDKISFETDIETDDFLMPPLVLQPIIENAVKHGLAPKPEGGTIKLSTRRDGETVTITISDDGVGFDTSAEQSPESVGLKNVKFRLEHMMNGTLSVESKPGKGTTVTIVLPPPREKSAKRKRNKKGRKLK